MWRCLLRCTPCGTWPLRGPSQVEVLPFHQVPVLPAFSSKPMLPIAYALRSLVMYRQPREECRDFPRSAWSHALWLVLFADGLLTLTSCNTTVISGCCRVWAYCFHYDVYSLFVDSQYLNSHSVEMSVFPFSFPNWMRGFICWSTCSKKVLRLQCKI